jgi:hypothetical protein
MFRGLLADLRFLQASSFILNILLTPSVYIASFFDMLNPYNGKIPSEVYRHSAPNFWLLEFPLWLVAELPVDILRRLVLQEICMPIDQYIMYQYRNNPYFADVTYRWFWVVRDVIRGTLIPAWVAVAIAIVGYLMVLDLIIFCILVLGKLFRQLKLRILKDNNHVYDA